MVHIEKKRAERRRVVCLIRDWLKSDSGTSEEEIQRKLEDVGTHLPFGTTHNYCEKARILLNREVLFGSDAERMFGTPPNTPVSGRAPANVRKNSSNRYSKMILA